MLVIGANAAGMTAASRAKRLAPSLDVIVLDASPRIAYSICGLPYRISGVVKSFDDLVLFTPESLRNERGIEARVSCRAVEIRSPQRKVVVESRASSGVKTGTETETIGYDKLVIATGYRPRLLDVEGMGPSSRGNGVFTASRLEDGEAIEDWLRDRDRSVRRAALIGGGYIGLEMAEALTKRGVRVALVESESNVLSSVDPEIAEKIAEELTRNGVELFTNRKVRALELRSNGDVESVVLDPGKLRAPADLVFVDVGVDPEVELAVAAGVRLGPSGAIAVTDRMETNLPGVYAAGNCAETLHLVSGSAAPIALGTVAAKQGRVVGENCAGRRTRFHGAVGTAIVKVFDLFAARTGLNESEARRAGFVPVSSTITGGFSASYFGPPTGVVKVIGDETSGRLLGAQIVGDLEAALRIDVAAVALTSRMSVEEAAQLDLAYAPPAGALWNPLLVALNTLAREL
jgi:NADPH-dependent 2,4-dienoyl-CoA reductase/sulfur reductase-like enzyme